MDIKNKYFPVLDHGFVALKDVMGTDEAIVEAARVSYGKGTKATSDDRGLIRYLIRNKHTTPIEMVVFKFHISMPIHCHRQFIRHRMSTTNEYSARYSVVPEVTYTPSQENVCKQSKNNKQGRSDEQLDNCEYDEYLGEITELRTNAFKHYNDLLEKGVAREVARMDLPLSVYTYFYWKIDLHNLFHFLRLRCDSHAQWEIRQFANVLAGVVKETCPIAFDAWYDYVFAAHTFTRLDREFHVWMLNWFNNIHRGQYDTYLEQKRAAKHTPKHEEIGMSKRELDEFWDKLSYPSYKDFSLDLSTAQDYSYFENKNVKQTTS